MKSFPASYRKKVRKAILTTLGLVLVTSAACGDPTDEQPNNDQPQVQSVEQRPVIYQLVVRLFGNTKTQNQYDGSLVANGVGKFAHINDAALTSLREMGTTHIWLTGVPPAGHGHGLFECGTARGRPGRAQGESRKLLRGQRLLRRQPGLRADPANRLEEFEALVDRIHAHDMKVVIDFVPNHVARTYDSDIKPELSFGADDDPSTFYDPQNNFFYLVDPPGPGTLAPGARPLGPPGGSRRLDRAGRQRRDAHR